MVHDQMKKTTYNLGHEPLQKYSSNTENHNSKVFADSKNQNVSRRCDPENPNRKIAFEFGRGWEAGV